MTEAGPKFNRRPYLIVLGVSTLLGILPLLLAWTGEGLAGSYDCYIGSGPPQTCMILGLDWGYALNFMFVMGWLVLLSLPVAMVINIVVVLTMIIHRTLWGRRQAKETGS